MELEETELKYIKEDLSEIKKKILEIQNELDVDHTDDLYHKNMLLVDYNLADILTLVRSLEDTLTPVNNKSIA